MSLSACDRSAQEPHGQRLQQDSRLQNRINLGFVQAMEQQGLALGTAEQLVASAARIGAPRALASQAGAVRRKLLERAISRPITSNSSAMRRNSDWDCTSSSCVSRSSNSFCRADRLALRGQDLRHDSTQRCRHLDFRSAGPLDHNAGKRNSPRKSAQVGFGHFESNVSAGLLAELDEASRIVGPVVVPGMGIGGFSGGGNPGRSFAGFAAEPPLATNPWARSSN